jgi:hypothetical protein
MMNEKYVEGTGHGIILRYYSSICLEELRKATKHFSQDIWSLGQDLS